MSNKAAVRPAGVVDEPNCDLKSATPPSVEPSFAEVHPANSLRWAAMDDCSLLDAALLTLNIEPSALEAEFENSGEPVRTLPENIELRIEELRSSVRAGKLKTNKLVENQHGQIDENKTRIGIAEFKDWCDARGLKHNLPNRTTSTTTSGYGSKKLQLMNQAAARFWGANVDKKDRTTHETNETVAAWLIRQGKSDFSKSAADNAASLIRPEWAPTGRKPEK
jgi:hypothetical protein